jgi:GntR family phosphonate transport system transcriptional regulator
MTRQALWASIEAALRDDIAAGRYETGVKLPSESELARRFGVNRHTVRRALAALAEAGLVHARQGAGVFVAARPTEYRLGRRVRFTQNLKAEGQTPDREILLMQTRSADDREAEALSLPKSAPVHLYEGLSLADRAPIAIFRSVFPAERFPSLLRDLEETRSVTAALALSGVVDYTRASTRLTAKIATPTQARQLALPEGAPILRTIAVNIDAEGRPVEYGHTWFAGDRVNLIVAPE